MFSARKRSSTNPAGRCSSSLRPTCGEDQGRDLAERWDSSPLAMSRRRVAACLKPASTPSDRAERGRLAERVGFEPTCRLRDKTLSRRPRYDHFGTSPHGAGSAPAASRSNFLLYIPTRPLHLGRATEPLAASPGINSCAPAVAATRTDPARQEALREARVSSGRHTSRPAGPTGERSGMRRRAVRKGGYVQPSERHSHWPASISPFSASASGMPIARTTMGNR